MKLETKRVAIYLAFAFGIAWACGLVIYLTGGLVDSPQLVPGTGITLAVVLLAVGYMWSPAVAHVLTRLITREGWQETRLRLQLRRGWPYWIIAWFAPAAMTVLGAILFFAIFPRYYDPSLTMIRDLLEQTGQPVSVNPWAIVIVQTATGVLAAPLVNSLFTFGEEFGWRAYLQPKLMGLGRRKALLLTGVIWGVWHWPVTAMGHNYGLAYPGFPWLGMLAMVWFTSVIGAFLGWVTLRSGSVWPAVIGHAAINGISGLGMLFVQGTPNPLIGPPPVGLIGSGAWALTAAWILLKLKPSASSTDDPATKQETTSSSWPHSEDSSG
ncbi:MAG: CPBP family intramembrane metalloprotease [Anaerolineae bacterium]|nr:CPBP family intramembrane metalloprotease [Anaerolineae bacterium]